MTTPVDTLTPAQEAVAAARAEIVARGEPDPFTGETVEPLPSGQEGEIEVLGDDDQVEVLEEEQDQEVLDTPEAEDGEDGEELLADLEDEEEAPAPEPTTPDTFVLPGIDEPVSLEELKNGFLRQADYTRKTQELARDREAGAEALKFYTALQEHPVELAKQLAVAAGLIAKDSATPNVVDLALRPEADIESEIERRVQEALESHPDIQSAQDVILMQWVESEFERIEKSVFQGKALGPKSRQKILAEADRVQTDDLEMVARALKTKLDEQARSTENLKRSAPVKPTGKASANSVTEAPETSLDAVRLAAQQAGVQLDESKLNLK